MRTIAFSQLSIPASACRLMLDRNPRPMVQRKSKPRVTGPTHVLHVAFAAAASHRGHTAEVAQGLPTAPAYVKSFVNRQKYDAADQRRVERR
jgi:hypothetical protein